MALQPAGFGGFTFKILQKFTWLLAWVTSTLQTRWQSQPIRFFLKIQADRYWKNLASHWDENWKVYYADRNVDVKSSGSRSSDVRAWEQNLLHGTRSLSAGGRAELELTALQVEVDLPLSLKEG